MRNIRKLVGNSSGKGLYNLYIGGVKYFSMSADCYIVDLETKICREKSTSLFMILYVVHKC